MFSRKLGYTIADISRKTNKNADKKAEQNDQSVIIKIKK